MLYPFAKMTVASAPGTSAIPLGSAVTPFLTLAQSGVQDGDLVAYAALDTAGVEGGYGVYTASGTSLSRDAVVRSSGASNTAKISLTSAAVIFITPLQPDFVDQANHLLAYALGAKSAGSYQRGLREYVDGYADSSGIKTASSSGYTVDTVNKLVKNQSDNRDLLLNFNGTNGSTTYTDSGNGANAAHTITNHGSCALDTGTKKFGTASLKVPSGTTNTNYVSTPNSADLQFGTGDYQIEFFMDYASTPAGNMDIFGWNGQTSSVGGGGFELAINSSGQLFMIYNGSSLLIGASANTAVGAAAFHHILIARKSSVIYLVIDGVLGGTVSDSTNITSGLMGPGVSAGGYGSGVNLWIDGLATLKGSTTYALTSTTVGTTLFTAPSSEQTTGPQNVTLVTTAQTPDVAPNYGRIVFETLNNLTPTTDITAELSFDNESNYTAKTLKQIALKPGGASYLYDTGVFAVPNTGTAGVLARIKTLTNKSISIPRLGFLWGT